MSVVINSKVDSYLSDGCGRCSFYKTPNCKVHTWQDELVELRRIVLDCGLKEEYKWSQPCYTFQGKNVAIVSAFKNYAFLSFFKGALLQDSEKKLTAPGENSRAARQLRFTNVDDIRKTESTIKAYLYEAIEVEKAGLKVDFTEQPLALPEELEQVLDMDEEFHQAFHALTPGRQRGYILYFSKPRQSKTRVARIEKYRQQILKGEGMHDAYKKRVKK